MSKDLQEVVLTDREKAVPQILTTEQATNLRNELERKGQKLVFTNGCFDLLHPGHVRYLSQARELGDALIVALNSDASVSRLKGPERPIHTTEDRAEVILGLRAVDAVVVFEEDRATTLLSEIKPHIYCKGGDYTPDSLHPEEKAVMLTEGIDIQILPLVEGHSTSHTLNRMNSEESAHKLRLGILGSGSGSNFASIVKAIDESTLDAEIAVVISDQPKARILKRAAERGIPNHYVNPGDYKTKLGEPAQKEITDRLRAANVDLVILAGFMRLVKDPLLSSFENRILNVHPSLLPKFKGLTAWTQALEAGESEAGCTVHYVTEEMDEGEIILQGKVPIKEDDSPESLHARIKEVEHRLYPAAIAKIAPQIIAAR